ncbi:MAG: deoxyribodipyrimidine photo-lyase [Microgenomates group bacterium]
MEERIKSINKNLVNKKGEYVLYWAQSGLRIDNNYSLNLAINYANRFNKPLLVFFNLKKIKLANIRQYQFLKEGLLEFKRKIEELGGNFLVEFCQTPEKIIQKTKDACLLVGDFGYLRLQRLWLDQIRKKIDTPFFAVENEVFSPLKIISQQKINFAFQIRNKIFKTISYFNKEIKLIEIKNKNKIVNQSVNEIQKLFNNLDIDKSVAPISLIGGESQAEKLLKIFIEEKLPFYKNLRSDPTKDFQSSLSAYLHFGFISPVKIVNEVLKNYSLKDENVVSFFNELLVWRELSRNFVFFEKNYNNWQGLPFWAKKTLDEHLKDKREYIYDLKTLEEAKTHDCYWNAAQKEMIKTGKMHNYMRMYWGKKLIEWTTDWKKAYKYLIYLNDKYELDGRDPNGYAGVAWCFGQFDHPWQEREIFGKVRYMNAKGLERKFNMRNYLKKIELLDKNSKRKIVK